MLERLIKLYVILSKPFLKRKLLKQYYEEQAKKVMEDFLKEEKGYKGVYDRKGKIKSIRKLEVI